MRVKDAALYANFLQSYKPEGRRCDQLSCIHCGKSQAAGNAGRLRKHLETCPNAPQEPVPTGPYAFLPTETHEPVLESTSSSTQRPAEPEGDTQLENDSTSKAVMTHLGVRTDDSPDTTQKKKHKLTVSELEKLTASCIQAKGRAYCPYSKFRVGATFLSTWGTYVSGANVENASYSATVCAERCALGTAVASAGMRRGDFKALGVATDTKPPASPCGVCRQGLREFCEDSMPIFMHDKDGKYIMKTLGELLPMSFGPEDLLPPEQAQRPQGHQTT